MMCTLPPLQLAFWSEGQIIKLFCLVSNSNINILFLCNGNSSMNNELVLHAYLYFIYPFFSFEVRKIYKTGIHDHDTIIITSYFYTGLRAY